MIWPRESYGRHVSRIQSVLYVLKDFQRGGGFKLVIS